MFRMSTVGAHQTLAIRSIRVLFALALLFSPSAAQVTAAEICRARCIDSGQASTAGTCCAGAGVSAHDQAVANPASDRESGGQETDSRAKQCPGCNARPWI